MISELRRLIARPPRLFAAIAFGGLVLRLAIAGRSIVALDRFFVPDDTYYTLAIARSIARGLGPTVDGVTLTNGFQPLLAFLLVPAFRFVHTAEGGLRVALVLLCFVDSFCAWLLGVFACRVSARHGTLAGAFAASAWALSPEAIARALDGLETSLATALELLFALAWLHARQKRGLSGFVRAGLVASLTLMARIDSAVLIAGLGVAEMLAGRRRGVIAAGASGILTIAPWWLYELRRFGTVVPRSGEAVRQQVLVYRAGGFALRDQFAWAIGSVLDCFVARAVDMRDFFAKHPALAIPATATLFALVVLSLFRLPIEREQRLVALAFVFFGWAIFFFYALYLPAFWFLPRYLAPTQTSLLVVLALAAAQVMAERHTIVRAAAPVAAVTWALLLAWMSVRYIWLPSSMMLDTGYHGSKGYRGAALSILNKLPRGAVVGSLQSGALAYYASFVRTDVRVVNLDGVVDQGAARAFIDRDLARFARERSMRWIADWPINLGNFIHRSGDARITANRLHVVSLGLPQGSDRMLLCEVDWP